MSSSNADIISDFRDMALFPCPDPRKLKLSGRIAIPVPQGASPLSQSLTETIAEGHYMLFKYGNTSFVPIYLNHEDK